MNALAVHTTTQDEQFDSTGGRVLHIRPIAHEDAPAVGDFVRDLSQRSRRFRFFTPLKELPPDLLQHLVDVDFDSRGAFAVTDGDGTEFLAVGSYELSEPGVAEVALAVADELQGEGIGTELLHHRAAHAQVHGIEKFTAYVLFENQRMFDVFHESGFPITVDSHSGFSTVTLEIK